MNVEVVSQKARSSKSIKVAFKVIAFIANIDDTVAVRSLRMSIHHTHVVSSWILEIIK